MDSTRMLRSATAVAIVTLLAGCATWNRLDRQEKGTALGATTGAVAGAAVGGPVGAAVGAGVGGYVGHEGTPSGSASMIGQGDARRAGDNVRSDTRSAPQGGAASAPRTQDFGTSATATSRSYGTGPDAGRTATDADDRNVAASAGMAAAPASGDARTAGTSAEQRTATMPRGLGDEARMHHDRAASPAAAGHDSETIRSVQQMLSRRGFDPGPIDGILGPRTEAALRRFQQSQGLDATGDLDARTLAALDGANGASSGAGSRMNGHATGRDSSGTQGPGAGRGTTGTSGPAR